MTEPTLPTQWQNTADAIHGYFKQGASLKLLPAAQLNAIRAELDRILSALETGELTVAQKNPDGQWGTHTWLKQAILLYFQLHASALIPGGFGQFYDKVPLRFQDAESAAHDFAHANLRVVPPACVRRGSHIGPNSVIMPSFVNIGAHVGAGCMIDTWATVGSCAYLGRGVHLSGGAGIGGVLEPLQATPTVIEDHCFIGARSEIVEGVVVETGAVIGMGVFIGQSTKIYDRATGEIVYGRVPAYSVVVAGQLPSKDGLYGLNCAVIVKRVDEKTRKKTAINDLLRNND